MYLERTIQLEPLLGKNYKYESAKIGENADTLEEAHKLIQQDLIKLLAFEKEKNPVKSEEQPF